MESGKPVKKILLIPALLLVFSQMQVLAADYYSIVSGNWNSPSTWSSTPGGPAGTTVPGGNNDNVYIENGHTVTVTADESCRDLFFTGASATLVINSGFTLTVKFTVTLYKLASANSTCTVSGAGTLDCKDIAVGSADNPAPVTGTSIYTHTFVSSVANLVVSNDITINSYFSTVSNIRNGVFNLESGIITVERNIVTNNDNASNTSTFSMASGAQTGTLNLSWSTPFTLSGTGTNSIILNGTSSLVNYNRNGAQTALATTYTNITLSRSGAKTVTGITVNGILSMEGTATSAGTTPSYSTGATLQYKGSAAQTTGIEFPATFSGTGGVIINNTSGVTLNSGRTISVILTFVNGRLITATNTLVLPADATVSGAGTGRYVNGNLQKGIAAGATSKTFEIGDAAVYAPVNITFSGVITTAGAITARTTGTDHPNLATSTFNAGVTVNRYWTLTNSGVAGFTSYNATFNFVAGDIDAGADFNYFYVGNYNLAAWTYPALGTLAPTSTQVVGLTNFGDFQIGERPIASFRTRQSGSWNQVSTWESFDGTTWLAATSTPASTSGYITIRSSHVVSNTTVITVDQVIIDSGGRLNLVAGITVNDGPSIDFTVYGILDCSSAILTGAGSFLNDVGGEIIIGSPDGITSSGSTGSIQTSVRTFSTAASYTYRGTSAQVTGNGLPLTVNNLTVDNSSGVTLGNSLTFNGTMYLTSGVLNASGRTLWFQTSDVPIVRVNGTLTTSSATDLLFGNSLNTAGAAFAIPSALFTEPAVINSLTLNRINSLTLNEQLLSVKTSVLANGPLNTNGNLVLLSDVSGTAYIDGAGTGEITGSLAMQRFLSSAFGYRYISSPFQAATVNELSDEINLAFWFPPVYRYDESRLSSGWVSHVNPAATLSPLQGYSVNFGSASVALTADIAGLVNNGALSVTLYNHNNTYTKGFNLVGNPYPSPIDWDAATGWTRTKIDNAVYFFKPGTTDQYGGTYSSYVEGVSSDGIVNNIIPSMQGFFIHVTDSVAYPVTGTLSLNNGVRINNSTQPFAKSLSKGESEIIRLSLSYASDTLASDPVLIYLHDKGSFDFDRRIDALKLLNTDYSVPNIYSVTSDQQKLSINAIPPFSGSAIQVPLGVKNNKEGTVIFRLRKVTGLLSYQYVSLYDAVTGEETLLNNKGEYRIHLPRAEYKDRFYLNINSFVTEKDEMNISERGFNSWISDGVLKTEINELPSGYGVIYITTISGQRLLEKSIGSPGQYEFNLPFRNGIYFITLMSGGKKFTNKFIVDYK